MMETGGIIEKIVEYYEDGDKFNKIIEPIIVNRNSDGSFDSSEILNRLAYTIIDQQRDVSSVVIPIWVTLMYLGVNHEFLSKSKHAGELVQSVLQAYGHQQYHTREDLKLAGKSGASRTDAFIDVYKKYDPDSFLNFIISHKKNIETIFKELNTLKFISYKSASFFLRDIEGIEYDILPIDVNVAYSFQLTGLFFIKEDGMPPFETIIKSVVGVSRRNDPGNYRKISDKMLRLCSEEGFSPHQINRYFFLLGSDFCQNLKCTECFLSDCCYFNSELSSDQKKSFIERLKSRG